MNLYEDVLIFIEFLYCAIDMMLLHYYCSAFAKFKIKQRMNGILIYLLATISILIATMNAYSALVTVLSLIIMLVYAKIGFDGKPFIVIASVGLYFAVSGLVSLLTTSLIPFLTPFASSEVLNNVILRFVVVLITKTLIFMTGYLFHKKDTSGVSTVRNIKSLLLFGGIVLLALILMFEFVFLSGRIDIQDLVIIMSLVFVIGVCFIAYLIMKYFEAKEANSILGIRLHEASLKNQAHIQSANEQIEFMKVKHDIKNHLISIENFLIQNKSEEAKEYLRNLQNYPGLKAYAETRNETINAILNHKISEYPDIRFKVRHDDGAYDLPSDKLTIILGNALDNAIEAVQAFTPEKSEIRITLTENNVLIKLHISNPFSERPVTKNGNLISQKGTKYSGIGMMNILEAAQSISGEVNYEIKDNIFELVILFYKITK